MSDKASKRPPRADGDQPLSATASGKPGVNLEESPLAWLARRRGKNGRPILSEAEFNAGERLRADFWFAHMTPNVTANWSQLLSQAGGQHGSPDHGAEVADHVLAARERIRLALKTVGPDHAGILIDVCCHLRGLESVERECGWPQRSAKLILIFALRSLARHYGYLSAEGTPLSSRAGPSHWGTADYKPRVGVEPEKAGVPPDKSDDDDA